MSTGYACSVCRAPVPDMAAVSCANCGVDFRKIGPAFSSAPVASPAALAPAAASGWQFPAEFDPSWSQRPWVRRHWRFVLLMVVIGSVIAVYGFLFSIVFQMAAVPTQRINSDLSEASGGEILSILPEPPILAGGRQTFLLFVADNVSLTEAKRLACSVVPGILAKDGYSGTAFELSRVGANDLADNTMACP